MSNILSIIFKIFQSPLTKSTRMEIKEPKHVETDEETENTMLNNDFSAFLAGMNARDSRATDTLAMNGLWNNP